MKNEIEISERSTIYDITCEYHSDLMCENYDAGIMASVSPKGMISIYPDSGHRSWVEKTFTFEESDPDRVIAIAKMMLAFAEKAKERNKNTIDVSDNV